jgi:catechol 2,3-dioxygenase-like lactoylglutathione lyase family enzyme
VYPVLKLLGYDMSALRASGTCYWGFWRRYGSRGMGRVIFKFEEIQPMTDWFARPVLHVRDVEASLRFYVDRLGFTIPWRYEDNGRARVAQVDRQGCALILSDQWPEKIGKGLMFISLNVEPATHEAAVAALDALRAELEAKGAPVKEGSWGYRLLVVDDPDGNQLFFNYPNETASDKIAGDEA